MGNQEKSWIEFIDYTSSTIQFTRRTSIISQYATTAKTNRSSVSCVTDQDTTYVRLLTIRNDVPAEVRLQIASDSGLCFVPGDVSDSTLRYNEEIKLGTANHKWLQVCTKNLYVTGDISFSGLTESSSAKKYLVIDDKGNVGWKTGNSSGDTGTSNYGSLTNKPQINGHTLASGNNTLDTLGIAARSHSHSSSDINWNATLDYKGFGHCHTIIMNSNHTMSVALTKDSKPALIPYYVSSFTSVDNMALGTGAGTRGCTLGNSNYQWDALYVKELWVNGSQITSSGGTTNYNNLSNRPQINSITLSGNTSLDDLGIGTRLSLYGTTLYLEKSNGNTIDSVSLSSLSGGGGSSDTLYSSGYSVQWTFTSDSKSTYLVFRPYSTGNYKAYLGDGDHLWQKLNCQASPQVYSDRNVKDDIKYLSEYQLNLDKFFFDLKPVSYHLKTDTDNNEHHYGLIAQDVEESFIKNHIEDYTSYGILSKIKLSKPNVVGLTEQYMLSYEEFIPINIMMTQKAHHRIDSLTEENQKLKNTILLLQGEIAIIKQKLEELI